MESDITVPYAAKVGRSVFGFLNDGENLRMARQALGIGVGLNLAEEASKDYMLIWCDRLVPENDHEVIVQRLTHGCGSCIIQFFREVDTANFRTERACNAPYFDFSTVHEYPRYAQPLLY
jgi:hypothetical protein